MSRTKKRRNRLSPVSAVAATRKIEGLIAGVKPEILDAGMVQHPIWVYMDDKWVVAEKDKKKFPFPVLQQVTPEWALEVLTERNGKNRRREPRRVRKYANDIFNGHWHVINNGIGFYEDGTLADGQHRLEAVVECEKTVPMIVVYGVDPSAMVAIDEGRPRSNTDVGKLMGLNTSNTAMSTANYMLEYYNVKGTMSRGDTMAFFSRHENAINSVISMFTGGSRPKGILIAPVLAAISRAWYTVNRDRLAEFCRILNTGMTSNESDIAALVLRNFLIRKMSENTGGAREEKYRKTESAIVHFLDGSYIKNLQGMSQEQFKVPETICKIN